MRTSGAPVSQGITQNKLHTAIGSGLRFWPGRSISVAGKDVNLGKLALQVLVLKTPLHGFSIKKREVLASIPGLSQVPPKNRNGFRVAIGSRRLIRTFWLRGVDLFPSESLSLRNLLIPREAGMPK